MQANENYEYIAQPNQNRFRFGKRIRYNSYSMRSEEPDSAKKTILGLGDSVLNGGVKTDHDSLATSRVNREFDQNQQNIQMLNVSAGSWGPDNCWEYVAHNGDFNADLIVLFVSSHDAYDNMQFEDLIDNVHGYESSQYKLAVWELLNRYLLPKLGINQKWPVNSPKSLGINKWTPSSAFNIGFQKILDYTRMHQKNFVVYLHAEKSEFNNQKYNHQGEEIIAFCQQNHIPMIKDLELNLEEIEFRDQIHINDYGQKKMAERLLNFLTQKNLL